MRGMSETTASYLVVSLDYLVDVVPVGRCDIVVDMLDRKEGKGSWNLDHR